MDKNKCFQPFRPWISENKAEGSEIEVMENLYKNGAQAGWVVQFMEKRDDFSEHLQGHYANECKHPSTTSCGRLCERPRNNFMTSEAVVYRPIPLIPWSLNFARIARPQTMPTISRSRMFQHINHRGRFKKYPCTFCTMAFCNYGQLRSHIRSHTGEKPFACDHKTCGRAFSRNEELTRHKRIHTGEKPYSCEKCGKNFARKDHMKKHFQSHDNTTSDDSGKCENPDKR